MSCAPWRRRSFRVPTTALPIQAIRRPCCSEGSTASMARAAKFLRRRKTITATMDSSWIERETHTMTALPMAGRRGRAALRLLAAAGLAAMLGGCYHTQVTQESFPADYRLRHPITVSEGEHTVEVFVGPNRGGLTPTQRADVLAFA